MNETKATTPLSQGKKRQGKPFWQPLLVNAGVAALHGLCFAAGGALGAKIIGPSTRPDAVGELPADVLTLKRTSVN